MSTPCSAKYLPAGLSAGIMPAGEMWSVVILSSKSPSTRAPLMSCRAESPALPPPKEPNQGGFLTYVEDSSQGNVTLGVEDSASHLSSPTSASAYLFLYRSRLRDLSAASLISFK